MKLSATIATICTLAVAAISNAAVTFNFASITGSANGPNGLPIVDNTGAAVLNSSNTLFASIGYLMPAADLTSPLSVLANFVPLDLNPLTPITTPTNRNGLFNGPDYSSAANIYPPTFQGKTAYVLVGNNAVLASSTAIVLFNFGGTVFGTPDGLGNLVQSFQLTSSTANVTLGTIRAVTTQPVAGNAFVNGVSMVPIAGVPEPSAILLGAVGALGLLRRRRN